MALPRPRRIDPAHRVFPGDGRPLLWFVRHRFRLIHALALETREEGLDAATCQRRFERATLHGARLLGARLVVTTLLAFGIVATLTSSLLAVAFTPELEAQFAATERLLGTIAAAATSASLLLLIVRMMLERAIERYNIVCMFLAGRVASG